MKKKIVLIGSLILAFALLLGVNGCKDEKEDFNLLTLTAGTIDLNGATAPTNVPVAPTILATFSVDVDAATVNNTTITLVRDYDDADIPLTITTSGKTITLVPGEDLANGSLFLLSFNDGIKSSDGQDLLAFNRSFKTEGTFAPSGQIAYWNFEENTDDQVGGRTASAEIDLTYADSYSATAGKAASFNGTTTIIEYPNGDQLLETNDFSLAFWVKAESANHEGRGHFVIGLGAFYGFQFEIFGDYTGCKWAASYEYENGSTDGEDLEFKGDGITGLNGGWVGWTFCKDLSGSGGLPALLQDKWAHVVCVYDSEAREVIIYMNGEKMKVNDFDLYPEGDLHRGVVGMKYGGAEPDVVNELAFGFIQSRAGTMWDNEPWGGYEFPTANHFGGLLDDVRIFHKVLTETEVSLIYESEK